MNRHIFFEATLGGVIGAILAGGLYSVIDAVDEQGRNILPGVLVFAGASFVIYFFLFLLELTFWSTFGRDKRKAKLSH